MLKTFSLSFTALFVALDIIGALPMYIAITRKLEPESRRKLLNTSMLVAFGLALGFVFVGQWIFSWLGISIFDFKIAGGLVLLLVALADLVGGPGAVHSTSGSTGVVPIAVPLITGPAILTQIILQVGTYGYLVTISALVLNYLIAFAVLHRSEKIAGSIGQDGITITSKIAALFLAAISIAMIRSGLFESILEFKRTSGL